MEHAFANNHPQDGQAARGPHDEQRAHVAEHGHGRGDARLGCLAGHDTSFVVLT